MRDLDLKTLSLQDALDLATLIEEEARDRYEELAEQMAVHHTPGAEQFFRKMIGVEQHHHEELARRRRLLFGGAPVRVSRTMIFDVEAPDYDQVRQGMSVREAFDAALHAETKAYNFFVQALPQIADPDVRELFEELRDEEVEHQRWVQDEIDRLPPSTAPEGDVSDEPVGH
ncbi:MAG: ferritin family protein [Acidobacteriota bacterium]|nr:ferritin family protein [Acidobacteriota bacterium]